MGGMKTLRPTVTDGHIYRGWLSIVPVLEQEVGRAEVGVLIGRQGNFFGDGEVCRGQYGKKSVLDSIVSPGEVVPGSTQEVVSFAINRLTAAVAACGGGGDDGGAQPPL